MTFSLLLSFLPVRDTGTEEQKKPGLYRVNHSNHSININKTDSPEESHISEMSQLQTAV